MSQVSEMRTTRRMAALARAIERLSARDMAKLMETIGLGQTFTVREEIYRGLLKFAATHADEEVRT